MSLAPAHALNKRVSMKLLPHRCSSLNHAHRFCLFFLKSKSFQQLFKVNISRFFGAKLALESDPRPAISEIPGSAWVKIDSAGSKDADEGPGKCSVSAGGSAWFKPIKLLRVPGK